MKRGEVWIANLSPPRGAVGRVRPALIVQADELTAEAAPLVIVLPLTTQLRPAARLWRASLAARGRLRQDCQVGSTSRAPSTGRASATGRRRR